MNNSRIMQAVRLWTIRTAAGRAEYLKRKKVFCAMGDHCTWAPRKVPLNPQLIKIGNNVHIASNVEFATHDIVHKMLNNLYGDKGTRFSEKLGCIEIGDNVFVGAGTRILYNVRIGSNVVIGVSSLILKDVPDNCVAAGVPARVVGPFDDLVEKRRGESGAGGSPEQRWQAFYAARTGDDAGKKAAARHDEKGQE